jgi:thiamine-monophosphate kinase
LPQPRLELTPALRAHASAAADVTDGLVADAGHIGEASVAGVELELGRLPLSAAAAVWLERQPDRAQALSELATGGDDYEIVCTAAPDQAPPLIREAAVAGVLMTDVGVVVEGEGIRASLDGEPLSLERTGWRHG